MKIKEVEAINLFFPFSEPIEPPASLPMMDDIGGIAYPGYRTVITKITLENGTIGFGESTARLAPDAIVAIINGMKPLLIGRDIFDVNLIWEQLLATMANRGHRKGYLIEAISGIDIAIWDLIGKTLNKPIFALLGGAYNKKLPCYSSSIRFGDREHAIQLAKDLVVQGFQAIKIKIGANPLDQAEDIELVRSIRTAVGPSIKLMVDANCAFDIATALHVVNDLEQYNVYWFEEPLNGEDLDGYIFLSRKSKIPIAGGETEFTRYGFRDLISKRAVSIIQPEICKAGGFTECMKIAAISSAFHVPYAPHVASTLSAVGVAATIHLAAVLSNFLIYEYHSQFWQKGQVNPFRLITGASVEKITDGSVELLHGPGLGIEIDQKALYRYAV